MKNNVDKFKRKHSVTGILFSLITGGMFFMLIVVAIIIRFFIIRTIFEQEVKNVEMIVDGKANEIGAWLGGTHSMLAAYAETSELRSDDWDIIQPLLVNAYDRINDSRYLFLAYVQQGGKGWTSKDKWLDARPLPYYEPIFVENREQFTTNPFVGATTNAALIVIGHGVRNASGKNQGMMIAGVTGESISSIAENIKIGGEGVGVIIDNAGVFVAHPNVEKVMKLNIRDLENEGYSGMSNIAEDMISGMKNMRPYKYNNKNYYMVYAPIPNSPDWSLGIILPKSYFSSSINAILVVLIPVILVVFTIVSVILFYITQKISIALRNNVNALKNIAEGDGDLTVRLPVAGSDEIAEISHYFNQTISKIGVAIKSVMNNTKSMNEIGENLLDNVLRNSKTIDRITDAVKKVQNQTVTQSMSVVETSETMEQIIKIIDQLNGSIERQALNVVQSSSLIEEMVSNISSVTDTLSKADKSISMLASHTEEGKDTMLVSNSITQKIVEESGSLLEASNVIQNIASQTNLLAMNAAIEAAHAGDSGKGFAVVADEIRKLAEESSTQGKSITVTLKQLTKEIETLSNASKNVEEKFNTIFTLSKEVKEMSTQFTEVIDEQKKGSSEILRAIKDINSVTDEVRSGAGEMLNGGQSVAKEIRKLDELTQIITEKMKEIADSTVEMNIASQEVSEITNQNKEKIQMLFNEVNQFKVD